MARCNESVPQKVEKGGDFDLGLPGRRLLVGNSPEAVKKHLQIMLKELKASGMVVNQKECQLIPTQQV